ncbi:hypothetical protein ACJMK2_011394 [Sinanodonta woodiana]|uniref:Phospholipase A2-like central domain-containing protein n=1 Tax=Sinanodonta woodiana TaxID=1069815 RepID=A0ABD3V6P6_SINWO
MFPTLVTGLLFAAILVNMRCVECRIKTLDVETSKSQEIMSVHERFLESIWTDGKDLNKIVKGIYPGTNWCGAGDVAKNASDYGTSVETDKCCQVHDSCEIFITARDTKYGLKNTALYTVSGCDCDQRLLDCMVNVTTSETAQDRDKSTANDFGKIFFNVISPKCLKEDYPIVCTKRIWFGICIQYGQDTTQPKVWQFAKGPKFPSR